jgi:uncharacterized coiled-coil protein SlyX
MASELDHERRIQDLEARVAELEGLDDELKRRLDELVRVLKRAEDEEVQRAARKAQAR